MVAHTETYSNKIEPIQVQPITPSLKLKHDQEQKVLGDCNQRLNKFIQRVVELEDEKNKILNELKFLFNSWGCETRGVINDKEPELTETRKHIDEMCGSAAKELAKSRRLEFDVCFLKQNLEDGLYASESDKQKIESLENNLESCKADIYFLNKVCEEKNAELKKSVENNEWLSIELNSLMIKLEESNYNCMRIDSQNQTIAEQIQV